MAARQARIPRRRASSSTEGPTMLSISACCHSHWVDAATYAEDANMQPSILYNGHAGLGANLRSSKNEVSIETLEVRGLEGAGSPAFCHKGNGIVTDNKDPDAAARAHEATSNAASNCRPEVDDEVLVAFAHGDPRHPFLIASLWNSGQTPPETAC
jgi:type VI secretion system (T6SS) baseplate-like injector VgrG